MQILIMSIFLLGTGLLDSFVGGASNTIPTREEQINLLTNVEEVFKQIKILVSDEGNSTDISVETDIQRIVERAQDKMKLLQELSFIRLSCTSNSVCMLEFKPIIQNLIRESIEALNLCTEEGANAIRANSRQLTSVIGSSTKRGQDLLDTLYGCSRKIGLQVISCYKGIIDKDVVPVKQTLLGAIQAHKDGHLSAIRIRNDANECVDSTLDKYQLKIDKVLNDAFHCK